MPAEILWSRAVGEPTTGPGIVAGRLLLARDSLEGLDPATGSRLWAVDLGTAGAPQFASWTARGDVAYAFRGRMVAVGVADGAVVWSGPAPAAGFLAVDAARLYVVAPGTVQALDPGSGALLWEAAVPEPFAVTAIGAGIVCVSGASILCLDATDGRHLWSAIPESAVVVDLDVGTGRLVAAMLSGALVAYDPTTGTIVWRRSLEPPIRSVAMAGSTIYACAGAEEAQEAGSCVAIEASNGAVSWSVETHGSTSTPLVREGSLIVADSRAILVIDAATGAIDRRVEPPRPDFHLARLAYHEGVLFGLLLGELVAIRLF